MPSVKEIVDNPNWYCHAINLDTGRLGFVKTTKTALSETTFLDARFDVSKLESTSSSIQECVNYIDGKDAPAPKYIFHTAFCCSTLLARCLDLPESNVSIKEPAVLMALANYKRTGHKALVNSNGADINEAEAIYGLVNHLLFRPFGENESIVVKPTNTVNNIICQLMATHPESKALLLHSDLKSFLISLLKKGEEGRGFARQLFNIFFMDSAEAQLLQQNQLLRMTDMQVAAITWHLQLENYFDAFAKFENSKVKSLYCDRLLDNSNDILTKVVSNFGLTKLEQNIDQMLEHAPLQKNSKTPGKAFTAQDRKIEHSEVASLYADSLNTIIPWAKQLSFKYPYSDNIANSL